MFKVVLLYLVFINILTFCIYGIDKYRAKHTKWRISETILLFLAIVGGSLGAWSGMKVYHHKTKHKKFKYGIPLIFILQITIIILIINYTLQIPIIYR